MEGRYIENEQYLAELCREVAGRYGVVASRSLQWPTRKYTLEAGLFHLEYRVFALGDEAIQLTYLDEVVLSVRFGLEADS